MNLPAEEPVASIEEGPRRGIVITALGITQIFAWGSSYYLPAVLAKPIADDTGWSIPWVVGGVSLGLLAAGLISPFVGRQIEQRGGRLVLGASAVLLAAGLSGLVFADRLPIYLAAWLVLGLGMGAGLYDAAFATLGRIYGLKARQAITALTLFGGLASTICWPLSAFLVSTLGWRGTCLAYAIFQLGISLPLYLVLVPRTGRAVVDPSHAVNATSASPVSPPQGGRLLLVLLAVTITLGSVLSATISVHLLTILQLRDIALGAAIALGALVGPSQVGARSIEMLIGRYHHPIWTKLTSTICVAVGLGVLWIDLPILAMALMLYGAGIGLESIARGTLPLALFGANGYALLMGRLAMPSLLAQAASPFLGALLIEQLGASGLLATLVAVAILNVILVVVLVLVSRPARVDAISAA